MGKLGGLAMVVAGIGFGLPALAHTRAADASLQVAALPPAARATVEKQADGHRIASVSKQTAPNGGTFYEARFKTLTTGQTAVDVAPNGALLGKYRKLDEPVGDGG